MSNYMRAQWVHESWEYIIGGSCHQYLFSRDKGGSWRDGDGVCVCVGGGGGGDAKQLELVLPSFAKNSYVCFR